MEFAQAMFVACFPVCLVFYVVKSIEGDYLQCEADERQDDLY
jgi:hypothetical protein